MRSRRSLAGQFLKLQLGIVLLVVAAVACVSIAQANLAFQDTEGRRLTSVAETVAATEAVRLGLTDPVAEGSLPSLAATARGVSGVSEVLIVDRFQVLKTGPDVNTRLDIGASTVLRGRAWAGEVGDSLVAHVPVLDERGSLLGFVAAGRRYPSLLEQLTSALPNLLTYLVLGCLLGVGGSLLLAGRVKRQTLGLEPLEIVGLAEHRETMLRGATRDQTQMVAMQHELDVNRYATDAFHSQAQAFATRLRGIAELLDGGRHLDATRLAIQAISAHDRITKDIETRIADPGVAALLMAKASLADAYGIDLRITDDSGLPRLAGLFKVDVVTVLALMVDRALEAARPHDGGWIELTAQFAGNAVYITVRDSSGAEPATADLTAAQAVCARRGGELGWHPLRGLTVWIPATQSPS